MEYGTFPDIIVSVDPLRLLSAHSLLNLESLVALGLLLALVARAGVAPVADEAPKRQGLVYFALCFTVFACYWRAIGTPFLYDDYTHITDARLANWQTITAAFGPVENPPGLFFRPFGFLVYWVNYLLAGPDPRWWHAVSLAFHAIDACLVYSLARAVRLNGAGSLAAAFLFACSGAAVEPAAWIDARFDPMATGLVLASLLCVCKFLDSGRLVWIGFACIAAVAGCASKESAFCLPLLVACLWFFLPGERVRVVIATVSIGAVAVAVFAYRWWALGGLGGYRGEAGDSNIESFSLLRTMNAVLVRDWTILFFPVNWSGTVGWLLAAMLCMTPVVFVLCIWKTRVARPVIIGAIAMTICAALPVQHLLLIGVDLANTRYVYLLSVGWALMWGTVIGGIRQPVWRWMTLGWMVALHLALGQHNLSFWVQAHQESRAICEGFGRTVVSTNTYAVVGGLPQRKNGAVFLANGFPQCVEMNGHVPPGRVTVLGTPNFLWNPVSGRIEKK